MRIMKGEFVVNLNAHYRAALGDFFERYSRRISPLKLEEMVSFCSNLRPGFQSLTYNFGSLKHLLRKLKGDLWRAYCLDDPEDPYRDSISEPPAEVIEAIDKLIEFVKRYPRWGLDEIKAKLKFVAEKFSQEFGEDRDAIEFILTLHSLEIKKEVENRTYLHRLLDQGKNRKFSSYKDLYTILKEESLDDLAEMAVLVSEIAVMVENFEGGRKILVRRDNVRNGAVLTLVEACPAETLKVVVNAKMENLDISNLNIIRIV